jgi:hypothetical protein
MKRMRRNCSKGMDEEFKGQLNGVRKRNIQND